MGKKIMNLMKDGWHYRNPSAIHVERGKILRYLYSTYTHKIIGFILINPIPAWDNKDTWCSLANSKVTQLNEDEVNLDLAEMPYRCMYKLLENRFNK